jgi:hypothetical protein
MACTPAHTASKQIGQLGALVVKGPRTRAFPGPASGEFILVTDPHLGPSGSV